MENLKKKQICKEKIKKTLMKPVLLTMSMKHLKSIMSWRWQIITLVLRILTTISPR